MGEFYNLFIIYNIFSPTELPSNISHNQCYVPESDFILKIIKELEARNRRFRRVVPERKINYKNIYSFGTTSAGLIS